MFDILIEINLIKIHFMEVSWVKTSLMVEMCFIDKKEISVWRIISYS